MKVVAHQPVGANVDGEDAGKLLEAVDDPLLAMIEALAGKNIVAAQEGTAHAAADAVVVGGGLQAD